MANPKGAGRPPKPTAQHIADGTFQPCRHANRADGSYPESFPEMPKGLGAHGQILWGQVVDNTPAAILRKLDTSKLHRLCRLWETWIGLDALISDGDEEKATWDRWLKTGAQWDSLSREFGVGPVSRARITVPTEAKTGETPMAALAKLLESRN